MGKYTLLEFQNNIDVEDLELSKRIDNEDGQESDNVTGDNEQEVENITSSSSDQTSPEQSNLEKEAAEVRDGQDKSQEGQVPLFRARIDFTRDVVYFNPEHLFCLSRVFNNYTRAPLYAFLWLLTELPGISTEVKIIALEERSTDATHVGPPLIQLENLERVIFVGGDWCYIGQHFDDPCKYLTRQPTFLVPGLGKFNKRKFVWPLSQDWPYKTYRSTIRKFLAEMSSAVMECKAFHKFGDSSSVEKWDNLSVKLTFLQEDPHETQGLIKNFLEFGEDDKSSEDETSSEDEDS